MKTMGVVYLVKKLWASQVFAVMGVRVGVAYSRQTCAALKATESKSYKTTEFKSEIRQGYGILM